MSSAELPPLVLMGSFEDVAMFERVVAQAADETVGRRTQLRHAIESEGLLALWTTVLQLRAVLVAQEIEEACRHSSAGSSGQADVARREREWVDRTIARRWGRAQPPTELLYAYGWDALVLARRDAATFTRQWPVWLAFFDGGLVR